MSKRAEQAAYNYAKENGTLGYDYNQIFDAVKHGYEQAEKDFVLTWEDVRRLLKIEGDLLDEELELKAYRRLSHKKFCQEVLRRFNEQRNRQ